MSSTIGCGTASNEGSPKVMGFVPNRRWALPAGATGRPEGMFVKPMNPRPASAACSANHPIRPRWVARRIPTVATDPDRAFSIAMSVASLPTGCPNAEFPSTSTVAPSSETTDMCAPGSIGPSSTQSK